MQKIKHKNGVAVGAHKKLAEDLQVKAMKWYARWKFGEVDATTQEWQKKQKLNSRDCRESEAAT